jgi:hypothetical protein
MPMGRDVDAGLAGFSAFTLRRPVTKPQEPSLLAAASLLRMFVNALSLFNNLSAQRASRFEP